MSNLVPKIDNLYVKNELFDDLDKIIKSNVFFPTYISGPSGIGKTLTVDQVMAHNNKKLIRTNITIESDEDSLMGGFRLIERNGTTVTMFDKGPVIKAMEEGAVLLLDEYDLGSPTRMLCLQSVMEGKGYFIKKTGEWVYPKNGFMIIATGNTKGINDDTGMYVGTQSLNEAALDRFAVMIEASYPTQEQEKLILIEKCKSLNINVEKFNDNIDLLIKFANKIRDVVRSPNTVNTDNEISRQQKVQIGGIIEYIISTRRLTQILDAYNIFKDIDKAINICLSRFDDHHKQSFLTIYEALKKPSDDTDDKNELSDQDAELLAECQKLVPF